MEEKKISQEVLDETAQEMRCRAEGQRILQLVWPALPIGTPFVIVTDRGTELLGTGVVAAETPGGKHVRVDFDEHELEKGRWYKVRPRREGDEALPRIAHDE